ncbi:TonB-dependent receptor [Fulvivirga imtechensis AK7]|uniref:TonB-dependent receptor n=1 Tax=Fulvivirga imtechensis AK7 TaxID=1237149 RepID=L8JQ31_9BACT|nr:M56 family metallopeptidase [Fulvivirga imtechensis]ELR70288.1 TonB-dependent receptor [Fulvivirga imtechensis AK7]
MNYILTSTACLTAFYLCYYLFLRGDKLMTLQRTFLLTALAISLAIPMVDLEWNNTTSPLEATYFPMENLPVTEASMQKSQNYALWDYVQYIYFLGVALMFVRLVLNFRKLFLILKTSTLEKYEHYTLVYVNQAMPISSFLRYIFISTRENFEQEELEGILLHESKHLTDLHSLDVLLMEAAKIIYWFNPMVYMMDRSLKTIHEYICDAEAVKHCEQSSYEKLLISSLFKRSDLPLLSQFSEVSVKKRIYMLNQKTPSIMKKVKYLLIIPITAALILACDPNELKEIETTSSETGENYNTSGHVTDMITVAGKVVGTDGRALPGVNIIIEGAEIGTVADVNGNYSLQVPAGSSLTASFIGMNSETIAVGNKSVIDFELSDDPNFKGTPFDELKALSVNQKVVTEHGSKYLTGKVTSETDQPVSGANIIVTGQKEGATTNQYGEFRLKLDDNNTSGKVVVIREGFKLQTLAFK